MSNEVLIALIGAGSTLIGTFGAYLYAGWQHRKEMEFKRKEFLAERKYDALITFIDTSTIHMIAARESNDKFLDSDASAKYITSLYEAKMIFSDDACQAIDDINQLLSETTKPDYQFSDEEYDKFMKYMINLRQVTKKEFIF